MTSVLESTTVFTGRIFNVNVDRVRLPHGREVRMEIVRHPGSVVLVPMPDADHVILVRQYRYAVDRWLWELPAGSLDPGEDALTAARRECHEEIGLVPGDLEEIGRFYPTPGFCDEHMIFFRLTGLSQPLSTAAHDEDESIEPKAFSLADARRLVQQGEIRDLKTAVGLSLL
jgi:ADP-ribose pyrophosphatase